MTPDELRAALDAARGGGAPSQSALATQVRHSVLELPMLAVGLTAASDAGLAMASRTLVGRLEEIAAQPLLEAGPAGALHEVWLLDTAVGAAVALRARIGERLRSLLSDRRPVPVTAQPSEEEEKPRPSRICDEAYLLLRQLVNTAESRTQLVFDGRAFRRLDEPARDAEIARADVSGAFSRLIEDLEA